MLDERNRARTLTILPIKKKETFSDDNRFEVCKTATLTITPKERHGSAHSTDDVGSYIHTTGTRHENSILQKKLAIFKSTPCALLTQCSFRIGYWSGREGGEEGERL